MMAPPVDVVGPCLGLGEVEAPPRSRSSLSSKAKVESIKAGLKDGSFVIWKGPIVDNTGKEKIAKGAVADDKFLGGVDFYVAGVEGSVPGKK